MEHAIRVNDFFNIKGVLKKKDFYSSDSVKFLSVIERIKGFDHDFFYPGIKKKL